MCVRVCVLSVRVCVCIGAVDFVPFPGHLFLAALVGAEMLSEQVLEATECISADRRDISFLWPIDVLFGSSWRFQAIAFCLVAL